jgi:uncharacterized protein (DUF885 family)
MVRFVLVLVLCLTTTGFAQNVAAQPPKNEFLHGLFQKYQEDRLKLFPMEATSVGDSRYNNLLPNSNSQAYLKEVHDFYSLYLGELNKLKQEELNSQDQISYLILKDVITKQLEAEKFHFELIPFAQFYSMPLTMGQLGSGKGNQPFKTVRDYENWLERISAFTIWTDTAIANFRKGVKAGVVLPKALVVKMIPQMESLAKSDTSTSIFYGPVRNFPSSFTAEERKMLREKYDQAISTKLLPCYQKFATFFRDEYLNAARTTTGLSYLPGGLEKYNYYTRYFTTTTKTPEEIYQIGLKEVARIQGEMERVKNKIGFKGSLKELFAFMQTDKQFMPFKTEKEVLDSNMAILKLITPQLKKLFPVAPKTPFEIRPVEAFRAAAAAPQYNASSADGTRPGIYYIPIVDPTKINTTNWALEATFLHEAIPGHHYQVSLARENPSLPDFRRFGGFAAFSEGWALYCESLGDQLGCYTNPYQKLGAYGNEIHRAIRLVVDAGMHTGKMTREDAIKYMMDNEAVSEPLAIAEIERYMAMPGQALSYKIGELKIKELRDRYQKQMGKKFRIDLFHSALLEGGSMPLSVLETYMDEWAKSVK